MISSRGRCWGSLFRLGNVRSGDWRAGLRRDLGSGGLVVEHIVYRNESELAMRPCREAGVKGPVAQPRIEGLCVSRDG